jgi:tRNA-2-methylthio-N6-dimethylallyladenosine synthase
LAIVRRFFIRTYGCQMNTHDTEKVANLLYHRGYVEVGDPDQAELLLINTCSIREKAEHRLYSDLGMLRQWKAAAPGRILGVGGCVAQQEGDAILRRFGHLDFVFGPHNLRLVPAMIEAARSGTRQSRTEASRSLDRFDLPERHPACARQTPGRALLTVMEGCDMFCSFCIVPITRGREISRPAEQIVRESESLAARGVRELTLLGQAVNAYGRHDLRRGRTAATGTRAFGQLLKRLARIPGIERLRYTSPHPAFFDEELIRAHGEITELCPHVHLPVQSGSDRILKAMRRRYTAAEYRGIVRRLRRSRPDIAITTDLIVGFPGETDADFEATLELVREVGFVDAYSFKYSARPGTAAAGLDRVVPPEVAQQRLEILQELQGSLTWAAHRARVGEEAQVLVEGESRRRGGQLQGRDPYHRVVNLAGNLAGSAVEVGDLVVVRIAEATPHSLIGVVRSARSVKEGGRLADEEERQIALA